jgi:hypothetical protein
MSGVIDPGFDPEKELLEEDDDVTVDRILNTYQEPMHIVGLKEHLTYDEEKLEIMHPKDLLKEIDFAITMIGQYIGPKRSKYKFPKWKAMWVDINLEWGKWSGILNRVIIKKLKDTTTRITKESGSEKEKSQELHNLYSWLNAYWWNRTHWIDKVFRSKTGLGGMTMRKAMTQGQKTLRDLIQGNADPSRLHPQFIKVIEDLKKQSASKDVQDILNK